MPSRESSKQRAVRIPLDYFKRPDRFTIAKAILSAVALLAAGLWLSGLGWGRFASERSRRLASPGPLARAHAVWDSRCDACHVPFQPISGTGWTTAFIPHPRTSDAKCQHCHDGPPHHALEAPKDVPACAGCHRDHRGRDVAAVVDGQCTRCHSALDEHTKTGAQSKFAAHVTQFDGHPEFRLMREGTPQDPGTIQFDHKLHMAKGITLEPGGKPVLSQDGLPIQLECASCHRFEGNGAAPVAITYETHCRACHPLNYDDSPVRTMRHGLQPAEVRQTLWGVYAEQLFADRPELKSFAPSARPIPGRVESAERRAARRTIERTVAKAEGILSGAKKCGECHARAETIAPARIPQVWFSQARFDHAPHRAVTCRECHERAYRDDPRASRSNADVLLPKIAKCQECHGSRRNVAGTSLGGAASNCVECHRYHEGDGTPARPAEGTATLRQFLLGVPGAGNR